MRTKYTKETLARLVTAATSMAGVMRMLNISMSGGMHAHLSKKIKAYGIDTSHWEAFSHNRNVFAPRLGTNDILSNNRRGMYKEKSRILLRALLQSGVPYRCNKCSLDGLNGWNGKFIRLHAEHKDGNNKNNVVSNLELLCPNCHSQTDTYAAIKRANGGIGRHRGLNGSLIEKLVRSMLPNSANPLMQTVATPSQPHTSGKCVETRRELPKAAAGQGEGIVQTTTQKIATSEN